jgi:hypothetical protein
MDARIFTPTTVRTRRGSGHQLSDFRGAAIAVAANRTCAIVSGAAKCWGKNFDGLVNGL